MVANLSSHKKGWDERWEEFSDWADKGQHYKNELLKLVDADTKAFNQIMAAFGLSKSTEEEKTVRTQAIQDATKYAIEIPFKVMKLAYESMRLLKQWLKSVIQILFPMQVLVHCVHAAQLWVHL